MFYKKPLPGDLIEAYQRLLKHAESILVGQVARQTEATHELLSPLRRALRRAAARGASDAFFGRDFSPGGGGRSRGPGADGVSAGWPHSSRAAGRISETVARAVARSAATGQAAAGQRGGSFFCVGDVKQAIYGWRGGVAAIFDALKAELEGLEDQTLAKSYRSAQPVIDAVNAVFRHLTGHPNLDKLAGPRASMASSLPRTCDRTH